MFHFILMISILWTVHCEEIVYYIAAVEDTWDYAPTGSNIITDDVGISERYLSRTDGKIGHVYKKVGYREFLDETFTTEKARPSYLGFIGPIITGNVGDMITVHFKNKAGRPYSILPLALNYTNPYRGSIDITSRNVLGVNPGDTHVYSWSVVETTGPRAGDPDCITSLYYSDVNMVKDVNTGLVGIMKICRRGTTAGAQQKHLALYLSLIDENRSWYLDDNIQQYSNFSDDVSVLKQNNGFIESNKMHSINGYVYGNMPPLSACLNDEISFHIAALGDTDDVHSFRVLGHSMTQKGKRTDAIPIYPGVTATATFNATEIGKWLIGSQSEEHWNGGMLGILNVNDCGNNRPPINVSGKIKRYYIAVEPINGVQVDRPQMFFQQYTDRSFTTRVERRSNETHLGKLGPVIYAEAGDTIKLVLYNNGSKPYSVYPRGLRMNKHFEGVFYKDGTSVKIAVPPRTIKTYYWTVPESLVPNNSDPACRMTFYTSEHVPIEDARSGLIGPMLICKEGTLDSNGYPVYMDKSKDMFLIFTETDTSPLPIITSYNSTHFVNGLETLPSIQICPNISMNLHLLYVGKRTSSITLNFNSNPVSYLNTRRSSVGIASMVPSTVEMVTKQKGQITLEKGNTKIQYTIEECDLSAPEETFRDPSLTLYIGIDVSDWNYSKGKTGWKSLFPGSIGPVYKKAYYLEYYTQYFGYPKGEQKFIGPLIKAAVGDSIKIVLKNKASIPFTIHTDGIIVEVEDKQNNDTAVNPGEISTFIWKFPVDSGPDNGDPPCVMRPYYSNINKKRDLSSGLVGPLIICKESTDTSINIPVFIGDIDETESWYIDENLRGKTTQKTDTNFLKGNRIYAINGYADGTFPDMTQMTPGTEVYLHIANIGTKFHSIHLNGNYFNDTSTPYYGTNVLGLYPGTTATVKVKMENKGLWHLEGLGTEDQIRHLFGPYIVGTTAIRPSK